MNFTISARNSAPNDGMDANWKLTSGLAVRSKQNSDAAGMFYQWGQKEPRTFATSSLNNGGTCGYGKYPVKIYNDKNELIFQEDSGGVTWNNTWLNSTGAKSLFFSNEGRGGWHSTSTIQSKTIKYPFVIYHDKRVTYYGGDCHELSYGHSVRCIEDATGR